MIKINKNCISCGVCVDICPVTALRLTRTSAIVDSDVCIDCGICSAKCPFNAIGTNIHANGAIIKDVRFQVTKGCNFNCAYCFADAQRPLNNELSIGEAYKMVDDLVDCGIKTLTLTGGEPLLRKEFCLKLIRYLSGKKIYSKLFTNGAMLDENMIDNLGGIVKEVQVSIHNYTDKQNWRKIKLLFRRLKKNKIRMALRITLTSENYKQVKNIMKFVEENKIDILRVRPFVVTGRGVANRRYLMDNKAYQESIGYLASVRRNKKYPIQLLTPSFGFLYDKYIEHNLISNSNFVGYTSCKCIKDMGAILPNGEVRACAYFPQKLGNIRKQRFKEIWLNNNAKDRLIIDHLDKKCMQCEYITICGGGCRANAYLNAGSLTAPDPNCPKN